MKTLGYLLSVIGLACILILAFGWFDTSARGDRLDWYVTGPPIIASFVLGGGLALIIAAWRK